MLTAAAMNTPAAAVASAVSAPPSAVGRNMRAPLRMPGAGRGRARAGGRPHVTVPMGYADSARRSRSRGRGHSRKLTDDPRQRCPAVVALVPVAQPGSVAHSHQPRSMRQQGRPPARRLSPPARMIVLDPGCSGLAAC
ncbi:hypothetical protein EAD89_04930 [Micromonospora sp. BL4]|nr:hypothetical protein EAD89_04930 [Micromonospora sp. BL4]